MILHSYPSTDPGPAWQFRRAVRITAHFRYFGDLADFSRMKSCCILTLVSRLPLAGSLHAEDKRVPLSRNEASELWPAFGK